MSEREGVSREEWDRIWEACAKIASGWADKIEGLGWKAYRVVNTVRVDLEVGKATKEVKS